MLEFVSRPPARSTLDWGRLSAGTFGRDLAGWTDRQECRVAVDSGDNRFQQSSSFEFVCGNFPDRRGSSRGRLRLRVVTAGVRRRSRVLRRIRRVHRIRSRMRNQPRVNHLSICFSEIKNCLYSSLAPIFNQLTRTAG